MRFYFEIDADRQSTIEEEGHDFSSMRQLRETAVSLLHAVARELSADKDMQTVVVKVRDIRKRAIMTCELNLNVSWCSADSSAPLPKPAPEFH